MERLGVPVWKVPTVMLPWHPGHAKRYGVPPRSATPDEYFEASLQALVEAPFASELGCVLTGYFASEKQVQAVCKAIDRLKDANPGVQVIVDPVSADSYGVYVPQPVVDAIRSDLLPRADLATPNRHELALFANEPDDLHDNSAIIAAVKKLGLPRAVVTSAHGMMRDHIGALLVDDKRAMLAEHAMVERAPNGTGDLFSALLASHWMLGLELPAALMKSTASVFEMVARSAKAGDLELAIAREQDSVVRAMAMVNQRQLAFPKAAQ